MYMGDSRSAEDRESGLPLSNNSDNMPAVEVVEMANGEVVW
jgi:hypothetical protein